MSDESLFEAVETKVRAEINQIHTALPAKVVSFNGHTVTIELMITKVLANGEVIEIPPLVDVIAQFPHAGGFCFTVPIKAGDEGLAIFSERCIDGWYQSGQKSKPLDARFHDLSDASFIVGVNSLPNKIKAFYHDGASMQTDDGSTYIRLTNDTIYIKGKIIHEGDSQQTGNSEQIGNSNQVGTWNQSGGDATAEGTISAGKMIANGIDVEQHTHKENGQGSQTDKPTKVVSNDSEKA